MGYTPVELRHVRVARRPFGYHRAAVEKVLSDVADSFEIVWRDRGDLAEKVEQLQQQLHDLKSREQVLTDTLVAAERASHEIKERAKREAELILAEAHGEARSIMRTSHGEHERLVADARRVEALLRSALGLVVEVGETSAAAAPETATEPSFAESRREEAGELRPAGRASSPEAPERRALLAASPQPLTKPDPATPSEPAPDTPASRLLDEQPGWPSTKEAARPGADFDWGE